MIIRPVEVDGIRRKVAAGAHAGLDLHAVTGITLGAALELGCADRAWASAGVPDGTRLVRALAGRYSILRATLDAFGGRGSALDDAELHVLDRDLVTDAGVPFFMRFQQALRTHGFTDKLDYGIAAAFREMADNVIQHSGPTPDRPAAGIVGYRVADQAATFAVADIGRGVLSSLQTNPRWASLASTSDALTAAICNRASRRPDVAEGNGFSDLHRALADLGGTLRFRSADDSLTLDGRDTPRRATRQSSPFLEGFQLSITCSINNNILQLL